MALDWTQTALDLAGLVPGFGEIADEANAGIYALRGDWTNAALSGAACIPFAGWISTGGNLVGKGIKAAKIIDDVGDAAKVIDDVADTARAIVKIADAGRMTGKEAKKLAENIDFKKINETSHGQSVFYNKEMKKYITPDIDSHNGGTWKMAESINDLSRKETRLGTYDANLKRIGD